MYCNIYVHIYIYIYMWCQMHPSNESIHIYIWTSLNSHNSHTASSHDQLCYYYFMLKNTHFQHSIRSCSIWKKTIGDSGTPWLLCTHANIWMYLFDCVIFVHSISLSGVDKKTHVLSLGKLMQSVALRIRGTS